MRYGHLAFWIGTSIAAGAASFDAGAQTCASPAGWPPGGNTVSGTTCGGDTTAPGYCGGNLDAPGPAFVMAITIAPTTNFTEITLVGGSGYDAVMYVSPASAGCGTNAACTATGDPGAPISSADIPVGSYYLIVTAATFDNVGACGTFTLASDLPVVLQSFTVD